MLAYAKEASIHVSVNRTVASPFDTVTGVLGELAFAEWLIGDWKKHDVYRTKGLSDFFNEIEIKTSAFPFSDKLNLLVREDYAKKRKPKFYVQTILNLPNRYTKEIQVGFEVVIAGYATANELDNAPLKDFGSKFGGRGGYRCHFIQISNLKGMDTFKSDYERRL